MVALIDLTGQKFGRFLVIAKSVSMNKKRPLWHVRCDCGAERVVRGWDLRRGETKSCGCYNRDVARKRATTHGLKGTTTYVSWINMLDRCRRENNSSFKRYGNRGITVCSRWKEFEKFFQDMGSRPSGLTLERIDNNAGYFPGNCRWASRQQQANNRCTTRSLTFGNKTMPISVWSKELGLSKSAVSSRLRAGWSVSRALSQPKMR